MTQTQAPLDQPLYGATLPQAVGRFFRKYATFSGRASRSEYWWVYLFIFVVVIVSLIGIGVLGNATQTEADRASRQPGAGALIFAIPLILFSLGIIVPAIALHVRRLHDVNISGLLYLITFFPYLGSFVLQILAILPSNPAGARFDAGAAAAAYPGAAPAPYGGAAPANVAAPGYTTAPPAPPSAAASAPPPPASPAPPVQAGPPPQAAPPPAAPPTEPPTA
jgi:uncharacterized membrane protein YhaH (DUF805 family)